MPRRLERVTNCAAALTILLATAAADSPYTAVHAQPGSSSNSAAGPPDIRQLDALLGRDLWKDRPGAGVALSLLDRLVGKVPKGFITEPVPWRIWKTDRNGAPRYIVLLAEDLFLIPSGSSACLVVLDAVTLQKRREILCFQTGWRIYPSDATFEFSSDLDSHLIVLHISRYINGPDISKEYFVLTNGDRLRLIRLEDGNGNAFPNNYLYSNFEIGMLPNASVLPQDWLDLLQSKSKADVLSALVFLGGNHIAEHPAFAPNRSKYADLFDSLYRNPKIRERITQLTLSPDPWIREAALLASRDRPF